MRTRILLTAAVAVPRTVAVGHGATTTRTPIRRPPGQATSAVRSRRGPMSCRPSLPQFFDVESLAGRAQSASDDVRAATESLVDEIRLAPETDGGEEIQSALDALDDARDGVREHRGDRGRHSGLTGSPSAITAVTASLSAMGTAFSRRSRRSRTPTRRVSSRTRSKNRPSAPTSRARRPTQRAIAARWIRGSDERAG